MNSDKKHGNSAFSSSTHKLYIAEKESVGRALAKVLDDENSEESGNSSKSSKSSKSNKKTSFKTHEKCGSDVVAWLQGHVLALYEPQDYDENYSRWTHDTILYVPSVWKMKTIERTKYLVENLKVLLTEASEVIHVGDPDREGQMLVDEFLEYAKWKGKTKRLWLNDVHPETIKKALEQVRDNSDYKGLYDAARARAFSDWLVGLALTRYITLNFRDNGYDSQALSVGRVQTPTLGLVVKRDDEIERFVPKDYFNLFGNLKIDDSRVVRGKWQANKDKEYGFLDEEGRIVDHASIQLLEKKIDGKTGVIKEVKREKKTRKPPLPYNLSKLQIAANQKYKIMDALDYVQKLYESGYVSYPRTNIRHLPEVRFSEAQEVIDALNIESPFFQKILQEVDVTRKSPAWNDKEVKEHYGIIPTKKAPKAHELEGMSKNIYEMIVLRYLLQFLPNHEYEQLTVEFEVEEEIFRATGRSVINPGWMAWDKEEENVKNEEEEDKGEIPAVKQGDTGVVEAVAEAKKTTPPKPYTFATLLDAMNNVHRYVADVEVKKKLKEVSGLGTAATQEGIIKKLFSIKYVESRKDRICSTELGRTLINTLANNKAAMLVKPDLTAEWEEEMTLIEEGKSKLAGFLAENEKTVRDIISSSMHIKDEDVEGLVKLKKCPMEGCKGFLVRRTNKTGNPFYKCGKCEKTYSEKDNEPVLSERKEQAEVIEAKCPLRCGFNARMYTGQYGPFWRCSCSAEIFKDEGGKPVVREKKELEKAKCLTPRCKGEATKLFKKADGTPFWKCGKCNTFFNDEGGKPAMQEKKR